MITTANVVIHFPLTFITATANAGEYLVALVWRGVHATAPSPLDCGRGDATAFPDDNLRRGVSTVLRIGSLQ